MYNRSVPLPDQLCCLGDILFTLVSFMLSFITLFGSTIKLSLRLFQNSKVDISHIWGCYPMPYIDYITTIRTSILLSTLIACTLFSCKPRLRKSCNIPRLVSMSLCIRACICIHHQVLKLHFQRRKSKHLPKPAYHMQMQDSSIARSILIPIPKPNHSSQASGAACLRLGTKPFRLVQQGTSLSPVPQQ